MRPQSPLSAQARESCPQKPWVCYHPQILQDISPKEIRQFLWLWKAPFFLRHKKAAREKGEILILTGHSLGGLGGWKVETEWYPGPSSQPAPMIALPVTHVIQLNPTTWHELQAWVICLTTRHLPSPKLTAIAPENRPSTPKGINRLPVPSIFGCENVSFRGGRLPVLCKKKNWKAP